MEILWVKCPCCGGSFPFPADHPVHTRDQLSLELEFPLNAGDVREIHAEVSEAEISPEEPVGLSIQMCKKCGDRLLHENGKCVRCEFHKKQQVR